jgi:EmrB/QacA subfamily drug resistance transporter
VSAPRASDSGATAAGDSAAADPDRLAPGTAMVLVAMGLGVLVIANDFTALNVALPAIEQDFDTDVDDSQWVINAYALTFGMAIVTGGRLADLFGRRRAFFVGSAIFAGFSALGGAAPDLPLLIAARVAMGIGAALMWPAILGMTYAALPAKKAGLAGGLILGAAGIGNAMGPLVGGALTDLLSWRWIFFLNVPIAAIAVLVTWTRVHQPPVETAERRIDYSGIASLSLGLLLILLGLDQASDWGFGDPRVIAMFALAVSLIVAFFFIEPRMGAAALVPSDVIRNAGFTAACLTVLMMSAVFFATVLYVPQFLQKILDYSPLGAGAGMLPMLAVFALVSFVAGPIYQRVGAKPTVVAGTVGLAAGPFLLSLVDADAGYSALVAGLVAVGVGAGLFYSSATTVAVTALDDARASLAGGLVYMFQIAGGAIGLGMTTAIFTTSSESEVSSRIADEGGKISEHQEAVIHGVLAGTDSGDRVVDQVSGQVPAERVLEIVRESFVAGLTTSFRVIGAIALVGVAIAVFFVGGRLGHREAAPSGADRDPAV